MVSMGLNIWAKLVDTVLANLSKLAGKTSTVFHVEWWPCSETNDQLVSKCNLQGLFRQWIAIQTESPVISLTEVQNWAHRTKLFFTLCTLPPAPCACLPPAMEAHGAIVLWHAGALLRCGARGNARHSCHVWVFCICLGCRSSWIFRSAEACMCNLVASGRLCTCSGHAQTPIGAQLEKRRLVNRERVVLAELQTWSICTGTVCWLTV